MLSLTPSPQPGSRPLAPDAPALLLYSRDLMLESRVAGDAQAQGWRFAAEAHPAVPPSRVDPAVCRLVVFDLTLGTESLATLVNYWQTERQVPVLAFGSHVSTELLATAERVGCREVWTRGRLHAQFAQLLADPTLRGRAATGGPAPAN
ncbi:MAG: hypothetical protein ACK5V1_03965 [Planctomycetaceae bacterium]|jgi:hypothetical protein